MNNLLIRNKKGSDIPSILYAIAFIFCVGIVFVIISYLAMNIYDNLSDTLNSNPNINATQANETLTEIRNFEQSMWDYAFLALILGYVLVMMILSFSTQINSWYYLVFVIIGMVGLFIGSALSNAWEKFAETSVLSDTIARFPITDTILNNFFPLFIVMMLAFVLIMLFGKRYLGQTGGMER